MVQIKEYFSVCTKQIMAQEKCSLCEEAKTNISSICRNLLGKDLVKVLENITGIQLHWHADELLACEKCAWGLIQAECIIDNVRRALSKISRQKTENGVLKSTTTAKSTVLKNEIELKKSNLDSCPYKAAISNSTGATNKRKAKVLTVKSETKVKQSKQGREGEVSDAINDTSEKYIQCLDESSKFNIPEQDHTNSVSINHFNCDLCLFESSSAKIFRSHQIKKHGIKKPLIFKCLQCLKTFQYTRTLQQHISFVHEHKKRPRNFGCEKCDKRFFHRSALQVHLQEHNPEEVPEVEGTKTSPTKVSTDGDCSIFATAATHKQEHSCVVCKGSYDLKSDLRAHFKKCHSADQKKACPNCGTTFVSQNKYKQHLFSESCSNYTMFQCQFLMCNKSFSKKSKLDAHIAESHSVEFEKKLE